MRYIKLCLQLIVAKSILLSSFAQAEEKISIKPDDEYTLASSFAIASHRIAVEVVEDCQSLTPDLQVLAPMVMGRWNEQNSAWIKIANEYRLAARNHVENRYGRANAKDYFAVGDQPWFSFIKAEKRRLLAHGDRAEMCGKAFIRLNKGEFDIANNEGYHGSLVVIKELLKGK